MNKAKHTKMLKKSLIYITMLLMCMLVLLSALLLLPHEAMAAPSTSTPIINTSILSNVGNKVVVISGSTNAQNEYATLSAAMGAIGTTGTDDYTIVFVQDYTMQGSDKAALAANATAANSMRFTSTYCAVGALGTLISKTITVPAPPPQLGFDWTFNAKESSIDNFTINVNGAMCVNMYANCHPLTIGENFVNTPFLQTTQGRIQLYGGFADGAHTGDTNITVKSGNFTYIFGGSYKGVLTGHTNITIEGTAIARNVLAGSQSNILGVGSSSTINIDGSGRAGEADRRNVIEAIYSGGYETGFPNNSPVEINLKNCAINQILNKNYRNTSTIQILSVNVLDGTSVVQGKLIANETAIKSGATLQTGTNATGMTGVGELNLTGDLTLEAGATYTHGAEGAQNVGGDLIINGAGTKLEFYKKNDTAAVIALKVSGGYGNITNIADVSIFNNVAGADGDVLVTYTNVSDADGNNFGSYMSYSACTYFDTVDDGANIKFQKNYSYPTYYIPTDTMHMYSYTEVGTNSNSDGINRTFYRKYDFTTAQWYDCDKDGGNVGTNPIDQSTERPQPNLDGWVPGIANMTTMVYTSELGKYRINAVASTNVDGVTTGSTGSASGYPDTNVINTLDEFGQKMGKDNASWATLQQSNSDCTIHKAYLIMTTTLNADNQNKRLQELLNNPMTLVSPDGDRMLSNGYIPENFTLAVGSTPLVYDKPTALIDRATANLGEVMTITDVTDFVKSNGYGTYYGVDIPRVGVDGQAYGKDPDTAIAWRLVVVEEDSSIEYFRKYALQFGPITNGGSAGIVSMTVNLDGYTTPGSDTDFSGQMLLIGSDNLPSAPVGGKNDSNICATFYPDANNTSLKIPLGVNDPDTPYIDRPISNNGTYGNWSQGRIDVNGHILSASEVSHVTADGAMGIDMSILDITNKETLDWATNGGHNLYLAPYAKAIRIDSSATPYGCGYIDTIGLSTEVAIPEFNTSIVHTDINTIPAEGEDIVAGHPVIVKAHAVNITPESSIILGALNSVVKVKVDEKLSNIRPVNGNVGDPITAKLTWFDPDDASHVTKEIITVTGVYNSADHTFTFDFGKDYYDQGNTHHLYNMRDDDIYIEFKADTEDEPTIGDALINYTNSIEVWSEDIHEKTPEGSTLYLKTPLTRYASDVDTFNTYINSVKFTKTVSGDFADAEQGFEFTVTCKNSAGGLLPEGMTIPYKGGTIDGLDVDAPANGNLIVDKNGKISFTLKHGQTISFRDLPLGIMNVEEERIEGYQTTWTDSKTGMQYVATNGTTGDIIVAEGDVRIFDFNNDNSMVPIVGIWVDTSSFITITLLALCGIAGFGFYCYKNKRKFLQK